MAPEQDFTAAAGPVTLRVTGLSKTTRALAAAGAESSELRNLMHSLGSIVVDRAVTLAPVGSGRLAGTLRAGRGKTKAVVRAGGARAPYAGVTHYGYPEASGVDQDPQPFLVTALQQTRPQVLAALDAGIGELLRRHHL